MIELNLQATIKCEEPECEEDTPAKLILCTGGVLAFQPCGAIDGWQLLAPKQPGMPFSSKCPKHKSLLQTVTPQIGPAGIKRNAVIPIGKPH